MSTCEKNNTCKEMNDIFSRTQMLLGEDNMQKLQRARVAVFGIGGVGGYAVEALARSGIGTLDLFDHDKICPSNINRQIHATHKTLGRYKVDCARERISDINPEAQVNVCKIFYLPENSKDIDLTQYDYVVDAIDTVAGKIELAVNAYNAGVPLISSMGAGNKLNAAQFEVADIYQTSVCPLAKVMRRELRLRGVERLKVVYSKEPPLGVIAPDAQLSEDIEHDTHISGIQPDGSSGTGRRKQIPGSNAFVPGAAGLIIAGEVVRDLINA